MVSQSKRALGCGNFGQICLAWLAASFSHKKSLQKNLDKKIVIVLDSFSPTCPYQKALHGKPWTCHRLNYPVKLLSITEIFKESCIKMS